MKIVVSDHVQADTGLEQDLCAQQGIELSIAQCATPDEVIAAARDADAIFAQYAPITRAVIGSGRVPPTRS